MYNVHCRNLGKHRQFIKHNKYPNPKVELMNADFFFPIFSPKYYQKWTFFPTFFIFIQLFNEDKAVTTNQVSLQVGQPDAIYTWCDIFHLWNIFIKKYWSLILIKPLHLMPNLQELHIRHIWNMGHSTEEWLVFSTTKWHEEKTKGHRDTVQDDNQMQYLDSTNQLRNRSTIR